MATLNTAGTTTPTLSPGSGTAVSSATVGGATTNSISTPSVTTATTSVNVGAIVGGAIGAAVVLGALLAFAWYQIRTRRRSDSTRPSIETSQDESRSYAPEKTGEQGIVAETQVNTALRYPDQIVSGTPTASGNISRDY